MRTGRPTRRFTRERHRQYSRNPARCFASLRGSPGIAFGDVIGANVAPCLVALGVGAVIAPLPFSSSVMRYTVLVLPLGGIAASRRPTGVQPDEKVSDYKQLSVRLPPRTVATLQGLSQRLDRPQWQVIVDAIEAFAVTEELSVVPHL